MLNKIKTNKRCDEDGTYVIPYAGGQEVMRERPSQITAQVVLRLRETRRDSVSSTCSIDGGLEKTLISSIDLFILIILIKLSKTCAADHRSGGFQQYLPSHGQGY